MPEASSEQRRAQGPTLQLSPTTRTPKAFSYAKMRSFFAQTSGDELRRYKGAIYWNREGLPSGFHRTTMM